MKENFLTILFYMFLLICIFSIWFYYFVLDWNFYYAKFQVSNNNDLITDYIKKLDNYKNNSWENINFINYSSWDCYNCYIYLYGYDYFSWSYKNKLSQKIYFKFEWDKLKSVDLFD